MFETNPLFGDFSVFDDVIVWGHGCAIKNTIAKTLDLHIQAQITNDATNNDNGHGFIDMKKILSAIGVNTISFSCRQTIVNIANQQGGNVINIGTNSGFTGLVFTTAGQLARMYTNSGSVGAWELIKIRNALQKGLIYNIHVYGASYS